jgi:predicted metal-dependent HD superfamily phosphohydrolase
VRFSQARPSSPGSTSRAVHLASRWTEAWQSLGATPDSGLLNMLLTAYGERHRSYHTVRHLEECFAQFDLLKPDAERPAEVELALWFHDAIYDPRRSDNEERSAQWAFEAMNTVSPDAAERVKGLVMVTRHEAVPHGIDAKIVVDVDLSILGAEEKRFGEYEAQIREEYAWVPRPLYRRARRKILEGFLERPTIFGTAKFVALYETQARGNLERALARL